MIAQTKRPPRDWNSPGAWPTGGIPVSNRNGSRVPGHVKTVQRNRGPVFYLKYRQADGQQVQKLLGAKWTERGRPPAGYYTDKTAEQALQAVLADARRGQAGRRCPTSRKDLR